MGCIPAPLLLRRSDPIRSGPRTSKASSAPATAQDRYPLTVTDHFSRCRVSVSRPALRQDGGRKARSFVRLFREVGLPDAIRTDNGAPFASTGIHGLAALNVWWMQLGIVHQRITPASPQENGTHERMHRELKRETARPAARSLRAQQSRFDAFCQRYNDERPHEGIGDRTPSSLWRPSSRPYPEHRTHPDYPAHMGDPPCQHGRHASGYSRSQPFLEPCPRRRRHRSGGSRRWHLEHRRITVRCSARSTSAQRALPELAPSSQV